MEMETKGVCMSFEAEIKEFLSLAGAIAIEEKENDWYKVTGAAHRLINQIISDDDMDKKKKMATISKIVDEIPGMLKKRIGAVVKALTDGQEWEEFAESLAVINSMAVFKVGEHKGDKYSDDDIEEIAANFKKLKGKVSPKLKITHDEDQRSIANLASYGDIESVVVKIINKVKHLFVSVSHVPKQVKKWVKDRRFAERSIELWDSRKVDGKVYKNVLRNVSLLGHEPPAVTGLEPIKASDQEGKFKTIVMSFSDDDELATVSMENDEEDPIEQIPSEGGDEEMELKEAEAQIAKLKESITALTADVAAKAEEISKMSDQSKVDVLTAEKVKLEESLVALQEQTKGFEELKDGTEKGKAAEDKLKKLEDATRKKDISSKLELWKKNQNILPKDEPMLKALMESFTDEVIKCSVPDGDGTKDIEVPQIALLSAVIEARKHDSFGEVSIMEDGELIESGDAQIEMPDGKKFSVDNLDIDAKARKYQADHEGVSYGDALIEVSPTKKS